MSDKNVNKVIYDGKTLVDLTKDTVTPQLLAEGATAHNASGEAIVGVAAKGVYYIQGTGSTAGTWLGEHPGITELFDGLTIAYKVGIAGASSTTLNINGLGAKKVVRNVSTAVTTNYGVNSVVILTYTVDTGTGYWKISDYDSDTKTRSSNKANAKMFLIGATSQSTSGQTTYSNANCYIGADNQLYSGGKKVSTKDYDYPTPLDYGAKGDGSTDDTAAFQNALAANRVVFVPGGTYKLSGELTIGNNCSLELSQDTVLEFTQTSGNCISMTASSSIIANHGLVKVPYAFTGRAINIYAGLDPDLVGIQPFTNWGPMWNAARYITDLHIVKLNSYGIARSMDGACSGTAVYLGANNNDAFDFLWAVDLTRLRIAGAFKYGIHLETVKTGMDGWIHQTRISGFVAAAEVGVYCKESTLTYLDVMVLPEWANDDTKYAKHGIVLENSTNVDLSGSRVMDWDANHSLWSEGSMYQHLALIGNCHGAILNEHYYYDTSTHDIRSLIYTDTPSNLEKLTILQEPFTRWFKPIDHVPYFNDGSFEKKLVLQEELDEIVAAERIANFTDKLSTAKDRDGSVFNGIGYHKYGYRINASDGAVVSSPYYGCTGFIPAVKGDTVYADYLKIKASDNNVNAVLYDSSFGRIMNINAGNIVSNGQYYYLTGYEENETGFKVAIPNNTSTTNVAYIRFTFERGDIGVKPVISVNEPITYTQTGYLTDGIKVKAENVEGLSEVFGNAIATAIGGSY